MYISSFEEIIAVKFLSDIKFIDIGCIWDVFLQWDHVSLLYINFIEKDNPDSQKHVKKWFYDWLLCG